MSHMTPQEIVSELDRHIVGQQGAKRAVAIALRNRWRRQQVDDKLRSEITPKNILLIGPTGVGKTEIARRLATLANAPFVKVAELTIRKRDLDTAEGKVLWKTQEFAYVPVHGNGSSPVLFEDLLIISADGDKEPKVIALDKNTGKQRWTFARQSDAKKKFSFCTPLIIDVAGLKQLITPGSGVVNALLSP